MLSKVAVGQSHAQLRIRLWPFLLPVQKTTSRVDIMIYLL